MYYTRLTVSCNSGFSEILIAELSEIGFDSFLEGESGFQAFAEQDRYDKEALERVRRQYAEAAGLELSFDTIQKENWNERWEKSYQPIDVEGKCLIRAHFHQPDKQYPYEIVITPKMSFGTGHHQTTYLMIKNQMLIDHSGKRVMDAGCGTAILSIMACKLGAAEVRAFDIDEWSVVNGSENIQVNNCGAVEIHRGTIAEVPLAGAFDIILANINKNVLLAEMGAYCRFLPERGLLLLSGFYTNDVPDLLAQAERYGLREVTRDEKDKWACLLLRK